MQEITGKTKKYLHLEGIRGAAAFVVVLGHFRSFFCADIDGKILAFLHTANYASEILVKRILFLLYDGQLPVCIFWFMSAYVISIKFFKKNDDSLGSLFPTTVIKRYFRLLVPVFFSSLLCFILFRMGLLFTFKMPEAFTGGDLAIIKKWHDFPTSFFRFCRVTIVDVFINGDNRYNGVLWTMTPELIGSMFCFAFISVFKNEKRKYYIYIALMSFFIIGMITPSIPIFWLFLFITGLLWADVSFSDSFTLPLYSTIKKIFFSVSFPIVLLIISESIIFYYNYNSLDQGKFYQFLISPVNAIGYVLLISNAKMLRGIFSAKLFSFLGGISFSLYLIHMPIMCSLGAYVYLYVFNMSEYQVLFTFLTTVSVSLMSSYFFNRFIDKKSIKLSGAIAQKILS